MNHKYLATWFISEEKINEILEKNKVDDSEFNSIREEILPPEETLSPPDYEQEGYEMLEEGIYLKEVSGSTWRGYVMLISDPKRVKLRDTAYQFEKGQTVKRMVTDAKAIAGINGGGFKDGVNYDSNGGNPAGLIIENGELINPKETDEAVYNMIGINSEGLLILRHCTAEWALENDIVSAVSFSPFIVVNGEGTIKNGSGGWGIAPRTAIGQRATGEFLFLVIDGRQIGWSIGCDLDVLQEIMLDENAENAAMLDGGSSTVLFYNGDYINKPSLGHERLINNCFIVE
jgi:exopolysaccharide biosynthesis protein